MATKRVEDVAEAWRTEGPVGSRRRVRLKPIKTGRLERDVDAVLESKGLALDQPLEDVLDEFRRRSSKLRPFRRGRRLG